MLADIPASEIAELMTPEKLRETQSFIERRLAEFEKKKLASPHAVKGRRKSRTGSR